MMVRRAGIVALFLFSVLPVAWAVVASLMPLDEVYRIPPRVSVHELEWRNYAEVLTRLPFPRFLLNSLAIASVSSLGAVLTSAMAGYALARFRFSGSWVCLGVVVLGLFLPSHALMIPRFLLCDALGWIGTYKPLIVPAWLGGGAFNIFLFRQYFRAMPGGIEDSARVDGASEWNVFLRTVLPAARPAVVTTALLSFVHAWQDFLDPLLYLSDFEWFPVSLGLRMYQSTAGTWANLLMAASVVGLLPVFGLVLLCERFIPRGMEGIVRGSSRM